MLLPLLGVAWVTGPLMSATDSMVIEYIFAVTNSLQGVFIFIVYCVMDNEVRAAKQRWSAKKLNVALHTDSNPSNQKRDPQTNMTTVKTGQVASSRQAKVAWGKPLTKPVEAFKEETLPSQHETSSG
ncbi:adhesion G protein-coupled receptor E2-like [Antedon mediterranea]|uniref:adhesion G protein-coupled receptor E2-like n=1 Tax=Antedon mediterranea TaxID=105859 RepID=UPI003AF661E4